MSKNLQNNLTEGNVPKTLIKYAIPMVATSLLQSLYSIIDMVVVGQFVGSSAISAINNGTLIMGLLTQIAIGLTIGGNILIGQYFGAKNEKESKAAAGTLFTFFALVSIVTSIVFFFSARYLLILLDAPSLEEATTYLKICSFGIFFIFGYNALSAILRAVGNSKKPLHFIFASTSVNIALDFLFVAYFDMGVAGAALATCLAQGVSFTLALLYVLKHRATLGFERQYLKVEFAKVRMILRYGFPIALQGMVASISWLVVAFLINQYGVDVSAANGVSNKIKEFCQLFIAATTSAAATMAAQNIGAGKYDRAKEIMFTCLKITLTVAFTMIIIVQLTAPFLISIFTSEPVVAEHAILNLRIEILAQVFYAGFQTFNILATGAGDTMFVMANSFLNCIVVRLVLAIILESLLGNIGIYIACMIAPSSSVPVGYWYYRSNKWRKKAISVS
ncbi:MAG: MATE family efflux transporter [Faecalibacterium sp.]